MGFEPEGVYLRLSPYAFSKGGISRIRHFERQFAQRRPCQFGDGVGKCRRQRRYTRFAHAGGRVVAWEAISSISVSLQQAVAVLSILAS